MKKRETNYFAVKFESQYYEGNILVVDLDEDDMDTICMCKDLLHVHHNNEPLIKLNS